MEMDTPDQKTAYQTQTAFVVGYTGEVGKELVKELLQRNVFRKVLLIGRREVQLEGDLYKNAEQKVVNFDHLAQYKGAFEDSTVGFCCLGTYRSKDGFVKVDHDYVVAVAKLAKELGVQHFSLVSSGGANKDSFFLYTKTKGLAEQRVGEVGFPSFTIFRPGFLICDRKESRFMERAVSVLLAPIIWAKPTWISVPTNTVAKAIIANLWRKSEKNMEIVENAAIHELAKDM